MKAEDSFTLTWCNKHKNWWVTNCPDCMVDSNEESIKQAGIKEVVDWVEGRPRRVDRYGNSYVILAHNIASRGAKPVLTDDWKTQLKEWGL